MSESRRKEKHFISCIESSGEKGISKTDVVALRRAYGGMQTAAVSHNADTAAILLKKCELRIRWVICRIRVMNNPTKCYWCLQFEYMTRHCSSKVDLSGKCRRCGKEGHIARNCGGESANDIAGSGKCPQFLMGLKSRSRR